MSFVGVAEKTWRIRKNNVRLHIMKWNHNQGQMYFVGVMNNNNKNPSKSSSSKWLHVNNNGKNIKWKSW